MRVLILAGGSGTRFWPASRRARPKQLLALEGGTSLLRATVDRAAPLAPPESIWISTTQELAAAVRTELPEIPAANVLAEPAARNTAPAIGWCLESMPAAARSDVVAVLPADHRMGDDEAFRSTLAAAGRAAAERDLVVTLGVEPTRPETGYGYLELGETLDPATGLARVERFREKPDVETAARFAASGRHWWNAGIFVFRGDSLLGHLKRLAPEVGAGLDAIAADPSRTAEIYPQLPRVSIDYAVMERLGEIAALPLASGWSDLGSWQTLAELLADGASQNAVLGDVLALDSADNLLVGEAGMVAVLGVSGLVVVHAGDAVLVIPKDRAQEVRRLVEALSAADRDELL